MALVGLAAWFCFAARPVRAQDSKLADGPPPPPSEESSSRGESTSRPDAAEPPASASAVDNPAPVDPASSGPAKPEDPAEVAKPVESAQPAQPLLDPVGASRSLEVGTFYMKKGDYDAAIDRFKEAADRQPKLAKPYLFLGEAYEKKNDPVDALAAYRKYLQLFPKAPDEDKVNKRIEKLTQLESKRDTASR